MEEKPTAGKESEKMKGDMDGQRKPGNQGIKAVGSVGEIGKALR